jgi:hypothetical protein
MNYGTNPQYTPQQYPTGYPPQQPGAYMTRYAPAHAAYTLPPRGHSPIGVVSFVLALLAGLGLLGIIIGAAVMAAGGRTELDEESPQAMVIGLVFVLSLFGSFIGLGFGIGGLFQRDRKRVFTVLGLCGNALLLLGTAGLIALGMAAG